MHAWRGAVRLHMAGALSMVLWLTWQSKTLWRACCMRRLDCGVALWQLQGLTCNRDAAMMSVSSKAYLQHV